MNPTLTELVQEIVMLTARMQQEKARADAAEQRVKKLEAKNEKSAEAE